MTLPQSNRTAPKVEATGQERGEAGGPGASGSGSLGLVPAIVARLEAQSSKVRTLRRAQRIDVSFPARLATGGLVLPVIISDVSVSGVGYRGQTGIADWTAVEVQLLDGRSLPGTVIWTHNGRGGIEFLTPLSLEDPLFGPLIPSIDGGAVAAPAAESIAREGLLRRLWRGLFGRAHNADGQRSTQSSMAPPVQQTGYSQRTLRRAQRKQGSSWLIDEDDTPPRQD